MGELSAHELLPVVYRELRSLAAVRLARERDYQTLQPTALVHEAYLRLFDASNEAPGKIEHTFLVPLPKRCDAYLIDRARR